jgi:hypothetical protein
MSSLVIFSCCHPLVLPFLALVLLSDLLFLDLGLMLTAVAEDDFLIFAFVLFAGAVLIL